MKNGQISAALPPDRSLPDQAGGRNLAVFPQRLSALYVTAAFTLDPSGAGDHSPVRNRSLHARP
ncbi:MAG: hypothetical protein ACJ786_39265, partial [Catenulispora sp.]